MYASVLWGGEFEMKLKDSLVAITFSANGGCRYTNDRMYSANGDPGEPGDEEYEVDNIDFDDVTFFDLETEEELPQRMLTSNEVNDICHEIEMECRDGSYTPYFD